MNCSICDLKGPHSEIVSFNSDAKILVCKNCGNAFTFPKPILPDYRKDDFHSRNKQISDLLLFNDLPFEIRESYRIQIELIKHNVPLDSTILEIGGGEGIFLDQLKHQGYNVELTEPSISAAERARKRGLIVHNDYFQNIQFRNKFSLVCMAHVLEHIDNPIQTVKNVRELIQPNGYLLLTQSNYLGFMPSLLKQRWYAWVPDQHFSHFTIGGISWLAKRANFEVVSYKHSRLYHGPSIYHSILKYIPKLQDQIHVLLKKT